MLRSMTGFGKGFAENRDGIIKIEIRSLNYKFFEVVSRLPAQLSIFEDSIREFLQRRISRGRLNLFLIYESLREKEAQTYIDKAMAKRYYNMMRDLQKTLHLNSKIDISQVLSLPGVIAHQPQDADAHRLWPLIEKALRAATSDLIRSKQREGRMLRKNLLHVVDNISSSLDKIKNRAPIVGKEYKKRLFENVLAISDSKQLINKSKLEEEAAIYARNSDVSEEIQRLSSHIEAFKKALSSGGEVGRRLDFMAQEMYRESNTLGAKANDFPISRQVIKIKSLVEKIREQAQNVE